MAEVTMLLLDSDFIIAARFPHESTHQKARHWAEKYFFGKNTFYLDLVLYEVVTVVSRKYSHAQAVELGKVLTSNTHSCISLTPELQKKAWDIFNSQKSKGVSFVDCANVAAAQEFKLQIASFDSFYQQFGAIALS